MSNIVVDKTKVPWWVSNVIVPLVNLTLALLVSGLFIFIAGENPIEAVKLIIFGCSTIIFFQFLVHLGVNIRILPTTGMTLPFLSYGGSSIVSNSILAGIILNLTKKNIT